MGSRSDPEFDADRADIFEAIAHPIRIRILQVLAEKPLGFADLRRAIGLESNGHLSFHLAKLGRLVKTTPEGDYTLTENGREALWSASALRRSKASSRSIRHEVRGVRRQQVVLVSLMIGIVLAGNFVLFQRSPNTIVQTIPIPTTVATTVATTVTRTVDIILTTRIAPSPGFLGAWSRTQDYPFPGSSQGCAASGGYIFCVGGYNATGYASYANATYFASLNSSGIGPWATSTPYPLGVLGPHCVSGGGFIFCTGGTAFFKNPFPSGGGLTHDSQTNESFYAAVSSDGIGKWTRTTDYPLPNGPSTCVAYTSDVYCLGGYGTTSPTTSTFFATTSSDGIGNWSRSADYPLDVGDPSCSSWSEYIYCVGGEIGETGAGTNSTYFAAFTPTTGVDHWTETMSFPYTIREGSCVADMAYLYCVGGWAGPSGTNSNSVKYAPIVGGGLGPWSDTVSYPVPVGQQTCFANERFLYCFGGTVGVQNGATVWSAASYYTVVAF